MARYCVHARAPDAGEVQIAVRASGLNCKDVLLVMGAVAGGAEAGADRAGHRH